MTSDYDHDRFYVMWRFLVFVYVVIVIGHKSLYYCHVYLFKVLGLEFRVQSQLGSLELKEFEV